MMFIVRSAVNSQNCKKHTRIHEFGRQKAEFLIVTVVKILSTSKIKGFRTWLKLWDILVAARNWEGLDHGVY